MKTYMVIILYPILFILISCNQHKNNNGIKDNPKLNNREIGSNIKQKIVRGKIKLNKSVLEIDLAADYKKILSWSVDSILEDITYIPLETKRECIIGDVSKIKFGSQRFFILDKISNALFVFSIDGKFEFKILKIGHGPKEYSKLSDFDIDEKNEGILLLTDLPTKVMRFSYKGVFIDEFNVPCYSISFNAIDENNFAFYLRYANNKDKLEKEYNLVICDKKGTIKCGYFPYNSDSIYQGFVTSAEHFYNFNEERYFYSDLNDTIYKITNEHLSPFLYVNFSDHSIDKKILNSGINFQEKYFKANSYGRIVRVIESNDIIIFYFIVNSSLLKSYYFKASNTLKTSLILDSKKNLLGHIATNKNEFFIGHIDNSILIPLIPLIDKTNYSEKVKDLIKKKDIQGNPIITMFKLKM